MVGLIVDWKTLAAWLDTEGSIISRIVRRIRNRIRRSRAHGVSITQKDKRQLKILAEFLRRQGINPKMRCIAPVKGWELQVNRIVDIEKIIRRTEPDLITPKRLQQVARFKRMRAERYERLPTWEEHMPR